MILLWMLACSSPVDDSVPPDAVHAFSFAVIADPHVSTGQDNVDRLAAAVAWIDGADRPIELVFVVGDIGWHGGLVTAKSLLDELDVPYVPVLGDNEIQFGDEAEFDRVFAPTFADLEARFPSWHRGVVEVHNPEHDRTSWFQNTSFEHRGVTFVALDWNTRVMGGLLSELADLHDFEGGTFPWFEAQLEDGSMRERIVMLSHHPMHVPAFDTDELGRIASATLPDQVAANYAGHYHFDHTEVVDEAGYDLFVTDATWDDVNRVRVVEVWSDGREFTYVQELVEP